MVKSTSSYPSVPVGEPTDKVVSHGGLVLAVEAVRAAGLEQHLARELAGVENPGFEHASAKLLIDLALALIAGGDCLADIALLRGKDQLFGPVASDPTVSRRIAFLASHIGACERALNKGRASARSQAWRLAGKDAPDAQMDADHPLVIDLDATVLIAHSDKEMVAATFKRTYGFHPDCAFVDHGQDGSGEPLAILLRAGNAGSNTADDHITLVKMALKQLPCQAKGGLPGRKILIRADGGGASKKFLNYLSSLKVSYSIGFTLAWTDIASTLPLIPEHAWSPALDEDGQIREGAWVCEVTDLIDLAAWPTGMRVIVRKEKAHPGAQTGLDDLQGHRLTAFATNTTTGQLQVLELRHRRRARCEDRIRCTKDTGLANLPLQGFNQNRIWCQVVQIAAEITAWMQMLAFATTKPRRWEPKRLRARLISTAIQIVSHARALTLRPAASPWTDLLTDGLERLRTLGATPMRT